MKKLQADVKQRTAKTKLILFGSKKSPLPERKKAAIASGKCNESDDTAGTQRMSKQEPSTIEKCNGSKQHNKILNLELVDNQSSSSPTLNEYSKVKSKKELSLMSQFDENFAKLGRTSNNTITKKAFSTPQSPFNFPRKPFERRNSSDSKASSDGSISSYKWQPNNGQKYKVIKLESIKRVVVEDIALSETMGEFQEKLTIFNALPLQSLKVNRKCLVSLNGTVNRARIIGIIDELQLVAVQYIDKYGMDHTPLDR